MNAKKFTRRVLGIWLGTLAVLSCGSGSEDGGGVDPGDAAGTTAKESPWRIGYSQCNRGEPWRAQMDADIEAEAAKHPEIELFMRDAQNEAFQQIGHVKEFITQGVDVLIISPKDTSLTQAVADAYAAGIHVIVLDRAVEGDQFTTFIGSDNRRIGAAVGKWVVETLGGRGKVVELKGLSSSVPAAHRSEPFRAALEGTDIEIVYEADMEWLGPLAREKMLAALERNPDEGSIQLVYGANDPAAIAAYWAAKDKGREDEMLFVGVDALPHEGIEAVRAGYLAATFEYPNGADIAIQTALKLRAGEAVEKNIVLGTRLFTSDNVETGGVQID